MITQITVSGIAYEVDEITKKYAIKKIGRLDRYLPKHARKSVIVDVKLREVGYKHGNKYQAEVKLDVPNKVIKAKDVTSNMLAAIDIVERKIQAQLREYKQFMAPHIGGRRVMRKIGKKLFKHR